MRYRWPCAALFALSYCLLGRPATAQRVATPPVAPRRVVVQPAPPADPLGVAGRPPAAAARPPVAPTKSPFSLPVPLLVLNASVVVGDNFLLSLNSQDIKQLLVYKGAAAPAQWRSLAVDGILDFTVKARVKSKTFAQLGRGLGLARPISYRVNDLPVADARLRIATGAIAEIRVTQAAPAAPGTIVNIRTVVLPRAPKNDPPGTIYLRGTAAR